MRQLLLAVAAAAMLLPATAGAALVQPLGGPATATNGIVLGPDGNVWAADAFGTTVSRFSAAGALVGRYEVGASPTSLAVGGGKVWVAVTGARKLVWLDGTAATPTATSIPTGGTCGPVAITSGGDGRMYFSLPDDGCGGGNRLGSIADTGLGGTTIVGSAVTAFDLAVSGGKLFAPDFASNVVHRYPTTLGPAESQITMGAGAEQPDGIAVDGGGNLWVTLFGTNRLATFPASQNGGSATSYALPGISNPFGVVAAADGRIHVTGSESANLARINRDGTGFTAFAAPAGAKPWSIVDGPDGSLLFSDLQNARVLRFLSAAPRAVTGAAAATNVVGGSVQASVDPRGNATDVVFDYGVTTAYGQSSAVTALPATAGATPVTTALAGLSPGTTYHVRVRATNAEGTGLGGDTTFTTPQLIVDRFPPPALPPLLTATATFTSGKAGRTTTVKSLRLAKLIGGETATLRCTGSKRCPFKTRTYKALKKGTRTLGRSVFKARKLPAGTAITVRFTRTGYRGRSTALRVRKLKKPTVTRTCLAAGGTAGAPCA